MTPLETWSALESEGFNVLWRRVQKSELAAAEKALGFHFPPSYVELISQRGAPGLASQRGLEADDTDAWSLSFAVLTPREVVKLTREWRTADVIADEFFEDPRSTKRVRAQLERAVFFQLQQDPNDAFVFLVDERRTEQRVADFAHDYLEELDWQGSPSAKGPVWASFGELSLEVARRIRTPSE